MQVPPYQIIGSADSLDVDIMVFVEELPTTIYDCAQLCANYASELAREFPNRDLNVNLCRVAEGRIVQLFKGIVDETNNALYHTYSLHPQSHPCQISVLLARDLEAKRARSARVILSYLTKSELRAEIKNALRAPMPEKIQYLASLDLSLFDSDEALGKNGNILEFRKIAAFQLGQYLALKEGVELYTKSDIAAYYPELAPYINRQDSNNLILGEYLKRFVA